jgi:hypothetical protein
MMASASAYAAAQMLAAPAAGAVDGPARAQPIDHPAKVTTSDSVAGRPDITWWLRRRLGANPSMRRLKTPIVGYE